MQRSAATQVGCGSQFAAVGPNGRRRVEYCIRNGRKMNHSQIVSFIWGVADLIRDTFKRGKYQDVILPLTVLRRLDCVLAPTKAEGARGPGQVQGQARQPRPAAAARIRVRLLQHVALRLREAARRRAPRRAEPAQLHRRVQPQHARGAGEVRLRQHHREARRGGSAVPGRAAVRRSAGEPAPGRGRQRHDGHDLRGAHPEVQRGAEREPRRALHPPRRRPPHGGPAAGRRRAAAAHEGGRAQRLRPVLRLGRHAHHRQGAHHRRRDT